MDLTASLDVLKFVPADEGNGVGFRFSVSTNGYASGTHGGGKPSWRGKRCRTKESLAGGSLFAPRGAFPLPMAIRAFSTPGMLTSSLQWRVSHAKGCGGHYKGYSAVSFPEAIMMSSLSRMTTSISGFSYGSFIIFHLPESFLPRPEPGDRRLVIEVHGLPQVPGFLVNRIMGEGVGTGQYRCRHLIAVNLVNMRILQVVR